MPRAHTKMPYVRNEDIEDQDSSIRPSLTQRYPYFWSALKWLAFAAVTATILYFSGGFLAIPFLAKLGAWAIPAVTPVLAGFKAALWSYVIKPCVIKPLARFLRLFRSKPDTLHASSEKPAQSPKENLDSIREDQQANNGFATPPEEHQENKEEDWNSTLSSLPPLSLLPSARLFSSTPLSANTLCEFIVKGNQEEAEKMLKAKPELLLHRGTAVDYAGWTFKNRTPFQMALAAGMDIDMCKMMLPYFDKLPDGRQKALQQYEEQLPEAKAEEPALYNFEPLIQAITDDPFFTNESPSQKTENALISLREYFKPGVIETGECFNIHHLIKAIEKYDENSDCWNWDQRDFFLQKVIGSIQRVVPACYAQAFCQGLYFVVDGRKELERSFQFGNKDSNEDFNEVYFPLDLNPNMRLGWDYAALGAAWKAGGGRDVPESAFYLKRYFEQKQSALSGLMHHLQEPDNQLSLSVS